MFGHLRSGEQQGDRVGRDQIRHAESSRTVPVGPSAGRLCRLGLQAQSGPTERVARTPTAHVECQAPGAAQHGRLSFCHGGGHQERPGPA